jgi:hypothetical protein
LQPLQTRIHNRETYVVDSLRRCFIESPCSLALYLFQALDLFSTLFWCSAHAGSFSGTQTCLFSDNSCSAWLSAQVVTYGTFFKLFPCKDFMRARRGAPQKWLACWQSASPWPLRLGCLVAGRHGCADVSFFSCDYFVARPNGTETEGRCSPELTFQEQGSQSVGVR